MDYVKTVKDLVVQLHDRVRGFDAEIARIKKGETAGLIGKKAAEENIASLESQKNADIAATHNYILSFKDKFKDAAEKAFLIDGSMNNSDAVIFQSGIKLTEPQFNAIVERNRKNPFVIALARKYVSEHEDFYDIRKNPGYRKNEAINPLPPSLDETIANYNEFLNMAASVCHNTPDSIRAAMFYESMPAPEGADLIE